jgi:four helix bundle protein
MTKFGIDFWYRLLISPFGIDVRYRRLPPFHPIPFPRIFVQVLPQSCVSIFVERNFRAYGAALDFNKLLGEVIATFPRGHAGLVDQLKSAALSIAGNLIEGAGRTQPRDQTHFYTMASGSVYECLPYIELAIQQGLIPPDIGLRLKLRLDVLDKMIQALIRTQFSRMTRP